MLLKNKVAVIYGAGGAIGGAVARAFAREGARLFLTGRRLALVEVVAKEVHSAGGSADAAELDALDEQALDKHLQSVIEEAGRVDIAFNAVGIPGAKFLGVPLVELGVEQFLQPITTYARSYFMIARLAARRMVANRSGVIMTAHYTALADRYPLVGRLRSGDGRRGGTHSSAIRRAARGGSVGWEVGRFTLFRQLRALADAVAIGRRGSRWRACSHHPPAGWGSWTPRSLVHLEVANHQILHIADYMLCPWILTAATSVVPGELA